MTGRSSDTSGSVAFLLFNAAGAITGVLLPADAGGCRRWAIGR